MSQRGFFASTLYASTIPIHSVGSVERTLGQLSPLWASAAMVDGYLRDSSISTCTPQLWLRSTKAEVLHTLQRPDPTDVDAIVGSNSCNSVDLAIS